MQKNKIALAFLGILPALLAALTVNYLPGNIPAHYNFAGEVTRYGSKWEVFILPLITLLIAPFTILAVSSANKDKQAKDSEDNIKAVMATSYILLIVFNLLNIFFLYNAYNQVENLKAKADYFKLLFSIFGAW